MTRAVPNDADSVEEHRCGRSGEEPGTLRAGHGACVRPRGTERT